jgi:hypothetical protein
MKRSTLCLSSILVLASVCSPTVGAEKENPFLGRWALTIPGGWAGWLEVTQEEGYLDASILWGGGSVVPVESVYMDGEDTLHVTRHRRVELKDSNGNVVRTHTFTNLIVANVSGNHMTLNLFQYDPEEKRVVQEAFSGKRIPPLPPKPDLSKVKFGEAKTLLKPDSLEGWVLTDEKSANGWSVKDGVLVNDPVREEGKPHIHYGNLRTVEEFEDFNLTLDVNIEKGQNSGIYLRGIYEVQIEESYGKPLATHTTGAVYSRITPAMSAEKPAGEWQTLDITLLDRHVTVKLNGTTTIDNEPLMGCTGGALWSDELRPGPIYLQGDHTGIKYRNIVLRPILK